ncbi:hypothetical protein ANABIO32_00010 [Rossellomorea marisflavi]|uniref:GDSL-type esterase/lipase family protein n=1 Tax=Rossellomorea marisflavi TaxID=189381 RepID=UPI0025CAE687|nr:GDSL-type esterase/lipase family protein [Rossellomorea marisflavi]GLI82315.1 hypothetical protein ANABIO32_00010 [Rossellomorea marisflavi]
MGYGNENSPFIKVDNKELKQKLDQDFNNLSQNFQTDINQFKQQTNTQLADRATKEELDRKVSQIVSGSPKGTYSTLAMLQAAKPSGDAGVYVVSADGKWYYWNNAAWTAGGVYQSTGLADGVTTFPKLSADIASNLFFTDSEDPKLLTLTDGYTSLNSSNVNQYIFIQDVVINRRGKVIFHIKGKAGSGTVFLMEKVNETTFSIKAREDVTMVEGVNRLKTSLLVTGNGKEYIGFWSQNNFYNKYPVPVAESPFRFYGSSSPVSDPAVGVNVTVSRNTSVQQVCGFYAGVESNRPKMKSELGINQIESDLEVVKEAISTISPSIPSELEKRKTLGALMYRKTTGNFSEYPNVYFNGRWFSKEGGVGSINQGASIFVKFTGTTLTMNITTTASLRPVVAVSIDGGAFNRIAVDTNKKVLASDLVNKEHYAHIQLDGLRESDTVWTTSDQFIFRGFDESTMPIKPKNRNAWFVGDSITAGINVLGTGSTPSVNCATKTYAQVCCSLLDVNNIRIAFGATGVTKSGSGGVPKTLNYIDNINSSQLENAESPDFIVINHGTNDSGATNALYEQEYRAVLDRLSIKYPGVPIICMIPFNQTKASVLRTVVPSYQNAFLVETDGWGITYSDGVHPDVNGGLVGGQKLAESLISIFGKTYFRAF